MCVCVCVWGGGGGGGGGGGDDGESTCTVVYASGILIYCANFVLYTDGLAC